MKKWVWLCVVAASPKWNLFTPTGIAKNGSSLISLGSDALVSLGILLYCSEGTEGVGKNRGKIVWTWSSWYVCAHGVCVCYLQVPFLCYRNKNNRIYIIYIKLCFLLGAWHIVLSKWSIRLVTSGFPPPLCHPLIIETYKYCTNCSCDIYILILIR